MKACVVTIILLLCTTKYSFESLHENYTILAGLRVLNTYKIINLHFGSKISCASYCLRENGACFSANYNKFSKVCELNDHSPTEELSTINEDDNWEVLYVKDDTWELAFRGTSGIGISLYSAYTGAISLNTSEAGCYLTHTLTCTTHYRNDALLDNWEIQDIEMVKVALYKNNTKVVEVDFFNDLKDSYTRWFSKDRLISSSYGDLTDPNHNFNHFSITGETDSARTRRFFINKLYVSCMDDNGWLAVFEGGACDYEKGLPLPYFGYILNDRVGQWKKGNFESADVFAIFVEKANFEKDDGSGDAIWLGKK